MILQRYIFRQILGSFLLTLATILSVMAVVAVFQILHEFAEAALKFAVKAGPTLIAYMSPYAILIAATVGSTLSYGRMAADHEIEAMRTSGYPTSRILLPACLLGFFLSLLSYVLLEHLVPNAHYQKRLLIREATLSLLSSPRPGMNTIQIGPYHLSYLDVQGGRLLRPVLQRNSKEGIPLMRFWAESAEIRIAPNRPPALVLNQPKYEKLDPNYRDEEHHQGSGTSYTYEFDIDTIFNRPKRPENMSQNELLDYIKNPETRPEQRREAWHDYFSRLTRPAGVLLLTLLGACVGMLTRKGSRLSGLGLSLPVLLPYFVLLVVAQGLGEKERLSTPVAAALPELMLLLLLLVLLWRVVRR